MEKIAEREQSPYIEMALMVREAAEDAGETTGNLFCKLLDSLAYVKQYAEENGIEFMEAMGVFIDQPDQMEALISAVKEAHRDGK